MLTHFMGSPMAFGGLIAMTSEDGEAFMLKADPTHERLGCLSIACSAAAENLELGRRCVRLKMERP